MYFVCFHPACVLLICLFVICHRALASMFALPVVGKCGVSSCFWFVNTMSSQPGPPPCRHLLLLNAPIPWNPGLSGLCGRAHWFPLNALSRSRGTLSPQSYLRLVPSTSTYPCWSGISACACVSTLVARTLSVWVWAQAIPALYQYQRVGTWANTPAFYHFYTCLNTRSIPSAYQPTISLGLNTRTRLV